LTYWRQGFDDDKGDYHVKMRDHVAYRYEVVDMLGKGSFGQVVKTLDHKTNKHVALKMIRNKKRFHQQALVEVKILEKIRIEDADDSANIVKMIDSFYFRGHLCIVFEMLSMNLYEFIKSNNFRGFSLTLIRKYVLCVQEGGD
jgi:dual specificity tyrosine-phosphorylation-regulated kinase 2/3/4